MELGWYFSFIMYIELLNSLVGLISKLDEHCHLVVTVVSAGGEN